MWEDPIVEEIRKIRLKIESECDNDFDKILAQAAKMQKKLSNRLVRKSTDNSQKLTTNLELPNKLIRRKI